MGLVLENSQNEKAHCEAILKVIKVCPPTEL